MTTRLATLPANGGPTDQADEHTRNDFAALRVPGAPVEGGRAGHSGLNREIADGDGDGDAQFVGGDCGICTRPEWSVATTGC